jgi:hypothetical protein
MIERFELNEEKYLEAMHILEFTDEQIEENRRYHGGSLYLSDDLAKAYSKFNDPLGNPEHACAMMQFRGTLMGCAEEFWADLDPTTVTRSCRFSVACAHHLHNTESRAHLTGEAVNKAQRLTIKTKRTRF